jgi:hypothetical protein
MGPLMLTRREDWTSRLAAALEEARDKPFKWGSHDCGLFAADCVLAMTDTDPAALYRGQYVDEAGARDTLWLISGGGLRAAWTKALGPAMNNVKMARRGDVALVEIGGMEAAGIVVGSRVACTTEGGLVMVPAHRIVAAWAVGDA